MKRFLTSLFAFVGLASAAPPQPSIQSIAPKSILFTTPTLSNDIALLEPVTRKPSNTDFIFHEDEWSQVEFFTKDRLAEVQRLLKVYKLFEQAHRAQHGWREVYVRKIPRTPIVSGSLPIRQPSACSEQRPVPHPCCSQQTRYPGESRTVSPCRLAAI